MISVTDRNYTGTQIVYTSAIAALNWKLVFFLKYSCVHDIGETLAKTVYVSWRYIFEVMYVFF